MIFFLISYIVSYVLGLWLAWQFDAHRHFWDYSLGALVLWIDILAMTWAWHRVFIKKAVAFAMSVIVLKYGVLVCALYWLVQVQKVELIPLFLGVGVIVPAVLVTAIKSVFVGFGRNGSL